MTQQSRPTFLRRRATMTRLIALVCTLGIIQASAADAPSIQWDWDTRTASCPPKVSQSTRLSISATGINDVLIDFGTGDRAEYSFRAKGSPVSVTPENPFITLQSAQASKIACTESQFLRDLAAVVTAVESANNPKITPPPGGPSVPVTVSVSAARAIPAVTTADADIANPSCEDFVNKYQNHPVVLWLKRLDGMHSTTFYIDLEPSMNYELKLEESWKGKLTGAVLTTRCGETDILTLSAGPLVSTLPYRTYTQQSAPVPAGSLTTESILTVGGNSNINLQGAALLNLHVPTPFLPQWTGLALSAGPVYKLGSSEDVSALGLFVGGSFHLYRSVFLSAGAHIGQFADFPAGFYPGAKIPDQFGSLNPITRETVHFAVGITFKVSTFKKSSQDTGTAMNTPTTGNSGAAGAAQQNGNTGSVKNQTATGSKGQN